MTKIPLGVSKYSNIPNFPFIIFIKTIATGINRIGQTNLKNEVFHHSFQEDPHGACGFRLGFHTGRVESAVAQMCKKLDFFAIQLVPIALILYT